MARVSAEDLGTQPIGKLLIKQAVPASIGILVMSLNIIVDTIFVGNWIGSIAIAAINVVLPVSFFIAALGMAIGIGGSSIISRALGANDKEKALKSFGNQLSLTLLLTIVLVVFGLLFVENIIPKFGGKGTIYEPAKIYYTIVLYGVPFLALCMMGNNVIRAEGKPKFAMIAMIIPSVGNLILDYILIYVFDFGMAGAAWATTLSYLLCFGYILWFFMSENSELKINLSHFNLSKKITSEIASLGSVTLARQAVVSVIYLFMNNILFDIGGESSVAVFGIISRIMMFALFPVLGITQGFLPIAGYNYGARSFGRVKETINTSILYASGLAILIFVFLMVFTESIVSVFTKDTTVINQTVYAMKWVFLAVPIVSVQLIGSAYFQAIGKAIPALLLTLSRQGFFFLPLVLILPIFYGEFGVWISFALADFLSTILTAYFINREVRLKLNTITG
jgi:putative MATE family efflux protein